MQIKLTAVESGCLQPQTVTNRVHANGGPSHCSAEQRTTPVFVSSDETLPGTERQSIIAPWMLRKDLGDRQVDMKAFVLCFLG